jgi:putative membrane protein
MKSNKDKRISSWLIVLLISLVILIVMAIISNAIQIGERLRQIHMSVEIAFYVLIAVVVLGGIVYPIVGVFFTPIFSLEKIHKADGSAKHKWCRKLANNLLDNVELTDEERDEVKGYLRCGDETDDKLIEFFDRKIRPTVNQEIFETAKKVFIITAISPNSMLDMLGMASANFSLIKRITQICGFRPSNVQVLGLYVKTLSMTLLAGGLEEMNIEEIVSMSIESVTGNASKISRIVGFVTAPIIQGTTNAYTTIRIGMITKNYLLNADLSQTRKELRKKSYTESIIMLKEIVKEGVEDNIWEPIKKFFGRKNEDTETTGENRMYWSF